jgi:hypothetical protein
MAFNLSTASITKQRPIDSIPWTRPGDWFNITSVPDNEIYYLVADMGLKTFRLNTSFTGTGSENMYIEWGDGTTTTISTQGTAVLSEKTYTTGGTPCSRGYNTYRIRIYADSGANIGDAIFTKATVYNRDSYPIYLLEAWFGNGLDINLAARYETGASQNYRNLEYVKLPETYLGATLLNMFNGCPVKKVDMPTSAPNLTNVQSMFSGSASIETIIFPADAINITLMAGTFNGCNSLVNVTLPSALNSVTSLASTFTNCFNLKSVNIPAMPNCLNYNSTFGNCRSLTFVEIKTLPTSGAISFDSTFNTCASLENVKLPPITGTATLSTMNTCFVGCSNLKQFKFPAGYNPTALQSTFQNCVSLQKVEMPSSMSVLNNLTTTFSGCFNLTDLTLPTTIAEGGIQMLNCFQNCYSISKITIPSGWNLTSSLNNMCLNCTNLIEFNFPANAQNGITIMSNVFQNCNRLKVVTMPTSMNNLTTLLNTFNGCGALETIVLPSALNSVTTIVSTFSSCSSLLSVTMPTSMSALTNYGSAFQNCVALKTITMPATVSASLTATANAFNFCINLETVTLPTTQTTLLNNVTSMFNACFSLKTINNVDKLGSTLTTGALVNGTTFSTNSEELTSTLTFACRLTKLDVNGTVTNPSKLTNLRLTNTGAGQWTGASPQINISFTNMSTEAINQLFSDMAAQPNVSGKTINITGATGAAGLTAANRLVITAKGWTITG